jgi:hypothetical protein
MNLNFDADSVPPGSLLLLPPEAATLLATWDNVERLSITIGGGEKTIKGQIALAGLAGARQRLAVACVAQEK